MSAGRRAKRRMRMGMEVGTRSCPVIGLGALLCRGLIEWRGDHLFVY